MKLTRWLPLRADTSRPFSRQTFRTIDELEHHVASSEFTVPVVPYRVDVELEAPPIKLSTLGPDEVLVVQLGYDPAGNRESLDGIVRTLESVLGDRWLVMFADGSVRGSQSALEASPANMAREAVAAGAYDAFYDPGAGR